MNIQLILGFIMGVSIVILVIPYLHKRWKEKEHELIENHERFVHVIENTKDFLYYYQLYPIRQYKYLSPSAEYFFGEGSIAYAYSDADVCFRDIHPDDYDILQKKLMGQVDYSKAIIQRWKDKNGKYRWFEEYATPIYENGVLVALQGVLRNVDERMELQEKLQYRLTHDTLTDIYNREFFEQIMKKYDKHVDTPVAIILCDLDELKYLNDHYGHKKGDVLIKESAKLLKQCFPENSIVSRIGGDEFAIIITETDKVQVESHCEKLSKEISEYNINSKDIKIKMSIGYAFSKHSIGKMESLFVEADKNMYQDKKAKKEQNPIKLSR